MIIIIRINSVIIIIIIINPKFKLFQNPAQMVLASSSHLKQQSAPTDTHKKSNNGISDDGCSRNVQHIDSKHGRGRSQRSELD